MRQGSAVSRKKLALDRHTRTVVMLPYQLGAGERGSGIQRPVGDRSLISLYSSWMVYDGNELEMKSLTIDQDYYFAVEAFNENGVSLPSETKYVE